MLYYSVCLFALLLLSSTKVYFSFLVTVCSTNAAIFSIVNMGMFICCSFYCVKLFSPPYCLTPPGKLSNCLMWYFQSLELLVGQKEQKISKYLLWLALVHTGVSPTPSTCCQIFPEQWDRTLLGTELDAVKQSFSIWVATETHLSS